MKGPKVKFFVFGHDFVPRIFGFLPFSHLGNRAEMFSYETKEINLGNRAYVKRPLKEAFALSFRTVSVTDR